MVAPSNGPTATDFPIELKVPSLDRGDLSGGASYSDEEALLWHGAPDETIEYIRSSGFNPAAAGEVGSMFGRGCYFAENSTKADMYSGPASNRYKRWRGPLKMILVV